MGTVSGSLSAPLSPVATPARIHTFFSAKSWIEGSALAQLDEMARLAGARDLAAFPDLHPGKHGATGVALLADRLHPQLIGTDIGCGMALFALDLAVRGFRVDKAEARLRRLAGFEPEAPGLCLAEAGLQPDLWPGALGSIGGGNHFCEVQAIDSLTAEGEATLAGLGLARDRLLLLVHSGSRGLGAEIFETLLAEMVMGDGLDPESEAGRAWLSRHDEAVRWAQLNRQMIAEAAAEALGGTARLIADVPHNLVRATPRGFVHHKGAALALGNDLVPVAGSRASLSHLVRATGGVAEALGAMAHGAGRKFDRASMHGRVGRNRSEREALTRNGWGGLAICDDRRLAVEEAAAAYKDAARVVADLEAAGLARPLATLKPLLTYKKALAPDKEAGGNGPRRDRRHRDRRDRHERD